MNKQDAEKLVDKYTQGNCTPEEEQLVEKYFLSFLNNQKDSPFLAQIEAAHQGMSDVIQNHIKANASLSLTKRLWPRIAVAAAILIFIGTGVIYLKSTNKESQIIAKNDIAPGANSATLTLANGQTIVLNKTAAGKLAVQGNMAITKGANGILRYNAISLAGNTVLYNTITTKRKEQYDVVLSDGTHVWLDAASSIKFPTAFNGSERKVEITGEAYFEVAHNPLKPFKVESKGQTVEVLGTHFNINSYADEAFVKTTLLEGSVKVTGDHDQGIEFLKPGQQAVLSEHNIKVANADTEADIAWKNGLFIFNDESLESIMVKIARWYDIDVVYDHINKTQLFGGGITRFATVSQVLKKLELTGSVHFKLEGRRVTVAK